MARSPFPTGNGFGSHVSEATPGLSVGAPAAGAAQQVAQAAHGFARQMRRMADRALTREGEQDAAEAIEASNLVGVTPAIRQGGGIDDEAFNAVVRENLSARRRAEYMTQSEAALLANPDSEIRFGESLGAVRAAFTPTGDAKLDADFDRFRVLQDAQLLGRARQGQEELRRETVRGAYVEASTVGRTALGQAIANAGFDEPGARLVGASLGQYAQSLAAFGPKAAFSVGGLEFAADATRAGVMSPEALAQTFDAVQREARLNWIGTAMERAPDATAQRAFLGQVQERWAAGDAAFAGLDAGDFGQLSNRLEATVARTEADDAARVRAAEERARSLLTAAEYGDDVDLDELRELAAMTGDPALIAQVDFAAVHGFEATPASLRAAAGGGVGADGFAGWVGPLLDDLEGPGLVANDNGRGRAQYGVTEHSHPEAWRDGRVDRAEAQAIYKREYWDPIGGDNLPPDLAFVAASAAVIGGVGTARTLLAQAGGDAETFLQLEERRFRRLARENPAKYADDLPGWLARHGKIRGHLGRMRAQRRARDGYASDPIGYSRGSENRAPLATVAELDPNALFDGDVGQARTFLQQRQAQGRTLSQRDGVPQRIFASEEIAFIKDRITRDPASVVTLARRAGQALGGEGARALLGEVGLGGADLRLAEMSLEPALGNVVSSILEGRRLRAENGVPPAFEDGASIDDAMRTIAPALASTPDLTPAVRQLAIDRAYADQARGRLQEGVTYVNAALGRTEQGGRVFGGLARVNGVSTVAPTWLRADAFDDALEFAARGWARNGTGPKYSNGEPIPVAVVSRYRPRRMANGRYQLINPQTGRPVAAASGHAFEVNLEAPGFREAFTRFNPSLTLGPR